jgi:ubiquinone/menaquinone biosynthesis C-methylase UbiE
MTESQSGWEELAAWYDERQGDDGDLWHRTLIDPALFRVLGPVDGEAILDLACGNGYISRRLAREGSRVTAVDLSAPMIERARQREERQPLGITYHLGDAARLDMLSDASFDTVVCNMALMDIPDAQAAVNEAARVLRPHGRFVVSLEHPCFTPVNASAWDVEVVNYTVTVWRKVRRYRELFDDWVPWRLASDTFQRTRSYHRPLSWYFSALRAAGLAVVALEEPEPTDEFLASESPQASWIAEVPLHCVIDARKLPLDG